jgi:Mg-chelatase subunit ChlD
LALAAAAEGQSFYPFADFSPELVAIRWARARGVPVEAFDLPCGTAVAGDAITRDEPDSVPDWDSLVEAPAVTSSPESTRRAALLYGWALRLRGASARDLAREAHMRARLAASDARRSVAVTGAFHCAALIPGVDPLPRVATNPAPPASPPVTSLLPWRADLLDARSGYPAGVEDPEWHARVYRCLTTGSPHDAMVAGVVVEVCRGIRAQRHVAGPADAAEALRIALELARIRGLGAPGRVEVLEAVTTALAQGEVLGRGRVIAKALERVLVGAARGRLAPGTPRSGLVPAVEALVAALRLPGPDTDGEQLLRLDPLRSDLDRRRHVALSRLVALDVPYARPADLEEDTLTRAWRAEWGPATEAALALAGAFGADLETAAAGALRRSRPSDDGEDAPSCTAELEWLTTVAECGLVDLARDGLDALADTFAARARLPEMVGAVALADRVVRGHIPGLQAEGSPPGVAGAIRPFVTEPGAVEHTRESLYTASVRALDGLPGSTDPADGRALGALVRLSVATDRAGDGRLGAAVDRLAREGAPRISGSATIARLRLGRADALEVGAAIGDRIEGAGDDTSRHALGDHLAGAVEAAGTLLESHEALLAGLARPIEELADEAFLVRLPALRHGFDAASPAARDRLLTTIAERLGSDAPIARAADLDVATRDAAARAVLVALGLPVAPGGAVAGSEPGDRPFPASEAGNRPHPPGVVSGAGNGSFPAFDEGKRPPPSAGGTPRESGARALPPAATETGAPDAGTRPPDAGTRPPDAGTRSSDAENRNLSASDVGKPPAAGSGARDPAPTGSLPASDVEKSPGGPGNPRDPAAPAVPALVRALPPLSRWRLVLGRESDALEPQAVRYASALDELYGQGRGEGSRGDGGGRGTQFPTAREWSDEVGALFGEGVRVEVVGRAAERGDPHALLLLDPETVTPSVALLEQALSLKGGLSEAQLEMLRRLCRRVTDALVEALAVRVRPALTGLSTPHPTRRHTDRLHLRRTIEANLRTAHRDPDGVHIVPERLYFRSRARRHMDWHVVLVVDTSGSMEASVVHAAMMAAILSALPAVDVAFYGFSDEVIDFTERVDDPLALLLEVRIGGGTRIHRALRYARERIRVPTRTLLVLVTDFEESGSPAGLVAEVRALAEAGVTLLGLAALDEAAKPRFSEPIAARVVAAGMPVAALSPVELARWVAERIRGGAS